MKRCTILEGEKRGPFSLGRMWRRLKGGKGSWEQERVEGGETGRDEGGGGRGESGEEEERERTRERERERAVTWRLRTRTNPAWFSTPAA